MPDLARLMTFLMLGTCIALPVAWVIMSAIKCISLCRAVSRCPLPVEHPSMAEVVVAEAVILEDDEPTSPPPYVDVVTRS